MILEWRSKMKKTKIFSIFILVLLFSITTVHAREKYKVTLNKCVDGDTAYFNLDDEIIKTRFLAIDTPESTNKIEKYGKEASKYTCDKLSNSKKIEIEYDENSEKKDKYGRDLVWVWVDNELLQEQLLHEGLAEVKYLYGDYEYTPRLQEAQKSAKEKGINIWSDDVSNEYSYLKIGVVLLILIVLFIFSKTSRKKIIRRSKQKLEKEFDDHINKIFK